MILINLQKDLLNLKILNTYFTNLWSLRTIFEYNYTLFTFKFLMQGYYSFRVFPSYVTDIALIVNFTFPNSFMSSLKVPLIPS